MWPNIKKTWHDAELYCNKEDGHLASVTNKRMHDYIWSKKKLLDKSTEFWIGGTDEEKEGKWRWTDGSPWSFTFWGATPIQQPDNSGNEDCLQINNKPLSAFGWNDWKCSKKVKFVCSRPVCQTKTITTNKNKTRTTKSDTAASTNDDTVSNNNRSTYPSPTVIAVTTSSGIILIGVAIIIIGCAISKRKKKSKGEISADINPVYGIYQLGEDYERQYSTNVAVDKNHYYEQ